jgi:hypothetical protein
LLCLSEEDLRQQSPGVFQHLFDRVKAERDQDDLVSYKELAALC